MSETESDSAETRTYNNPYGQKGILKCQRCRDRRKKCIYQNETDLCQYCLSHQFRDCVKELGAVQKQKQAPPNQTPKFSGIAQKLEEANPLAGYDDILETIRKNGDYIKAHGPCQAVANPTGNRQTTVKPSAVAAEYERMFPSESFDQILGRVYQYPN